MPLYCVYRKIFMRCIYSSGAIFLFDCYLEITFTSFFSLKNTLNSSGLLKEAKHRFRNLFHNAKLIYLNNRYFLY
jgi:hypothetical protein